uniref:Uncharacterized protein n=1 Tax=Arundo donax TaxID=35708 RepID=A0A0A9FA93_ARUDO
MISYKYIYHESDMTIHSMDLIKHASHWISQKVIFIFVFLFARKIISMI